MAGIAFTLLGFGLRQVIGEPGDRVAAVVVGHFTDHGATLSRALASANDRAWKALAVALAGEGLLDQIGRLFSSGIDRGVREQVRQFLEANPTLYSDTPQEFRRACLAELEQARRTGLLSADRLAPDDLAGRAAAFQRYSDPQGLITSADQAVREMADALAPHCPNLSKLLSRPTPGGPPLLVAAFAYFFRREVELDDELANGLMFDGLRQLSASQARGFAEVGKAITELGGQFDVAVRGIVEQLERLGRAVAQTRDAAVETRDAVLDMQAELRRLADLREGGVDEVRRLVEEATARLAAASIRGGELRPQYSFSIRDDRERRAVKELLARFRRLPPERQHRTPALLNALGKLQVGSGDFDGAARTFGEVAGCAAGDPYAEAEAHYNTYLADLERGEWDEALQAVVRAAGLDPGRFAPFPTARYRPVRILGSGGFGTAFLCHDRFLKSDVVVKALHTSELDRDVDAVFAEAQVLRVLRHPSLIGVIDCNYADPSAMSRPYIVMEYFPGTTLEAYVREHGPVREGGLADVALRVAEGMMAAHAQGVMHRDLKPENVLVRHGGDGGGGGWDVRVIDFGQALRRPVVERGAAAASASARSILINSAAGTMKYAPPEQMGESPGVAVGPHSDVYAFGKTLCFALFQTTEPKRRHLIGVSPAWAELLEQCTDHDVGHRYPGFGPVIEQLRALKEPAPSPEPGPVGRVPETTRSEPGWGLRFRGTIRSAGDNADGSESQYIAVKKQDAAGFPYDEGKPVPVKLDVAGGVYDASVRTTPGQDIVYVASGLRDADGRRVRLAAVLEGAGLRRNDRVTLDVEGTRLRVLPADAAGAGAGAAAGSSTRRAPIKEDDYFRQLVGSAGPAAAAFARAVLDEADAHGLRVVWGDSGPVVKYVHGPTRTDFTFGSLGRTGALDNTLFLSRRCIEKGLPPETWRGYLNDVAALVPGASRGPTKRPEWEAVGYGNKQGVPLALLAPHKDAWFAAVDRAVVRIREALEPSGGGFFTSLHRKAAARMPDVFASSKPSTAELRAEISKGVVLAFGFTDGLPRVELYLLNTPGGSPKEVFALLHSQKDQVEQRFGGPLIWDPMEGKAGSRVRALLPSGSVSDRSNWPSLQDQMVDLMVRFEAALRPALKAVAR